MNRTENEKKERMRISLSFSEKSQEEIKLYDKLKSYSNTSSIIKDILLGRLPIEVLGLDTNTKKKTKFECIDLSEVMYK